MKFNEMPYERIKTEEMKERMAELTDKLRNAKSGEEQFAIHQDYYAFTDRIITSMVLSEVRHSIDTTDPFYEAEDEYYNGFRAVFYETDNQYKKALFESPFRAYLEEKIGPVAFKNIEIALKAMDEKIIPLVEEENKLISRYDKLIATAKIEFEGEIYNISLLRPHLTHEDREHRKRAWKALSAYFQSVTAEIDEIYDKMVKNRTEQARVMGYKDYVELGYYRMNRNSYDREMVEGFRKRVKEEFVPLVCELQERRRARIGVEKLLCYDNDVFFTQGNPRPSGSPEEILEAGRKMYHELSPETAEFFDFMQEHELFDVLGRKNKQAGGYMTFIPDYKAPFIFANFNGTSGDVDVITHECGHAFQGYLTRNDPIREHNDLTMETAEIHSMSMEYFTYGWMKNFFGDRSEDYMLMHLEDSMTFLPYGCMVDEFQHIVYEKPELTPAERKAVWKELEAQYRPWLDYDADPFFGEGGWWQRQSHIFDMPFYYIDYVLASVCAMQFRLLMEQDRKDAWQRYLKLCALSVSDFYENELHAVGLRSPFDENCISELVAGMKKLL
ncbi:MAG: M3 family oligoendopeptidase [Lachnospiraceae bacterium]|nr:M3 family oligoendopeptidase [Lachnospiraceae bacterium]